MSTLPARLPADLSFPLKSAHGGVFGGRPVDFLIGRLKKKIDEDTSFSVKRFIKTGSLVKGTVLNPRGDWQADADIAVELVVTEPDRSDIVKLHHIILKLLIAIYPQKSEEESDPVVVLDPVNATNNITRRITDAERQEVVTTATKAWERLWTASQNNYKTETVQMST
jgi:tRNA nucleotidyltransferase (CCA-adding enzyme)